MAITPPTKDIVSTPPKWGPGTGNADRHKRPAGRRTICLNNQLALALGTRISASLPISVQTLYLGIVSPMLDSASGRVPFGRSGSCARSCAAQCTAHARRMHLDAASPTILQVGGRRMGVPTSSVSRRPDLDASDRGLKPPSQPGEAALGGDAARCGSSDTNAGSMIRCQTSQAPGVADLPH